MCCLLGHHIILQTFLSELGSWTFLGHDYNPSSVEGAGQEIQLLSGFLAELDRRIANCLQACEAHVMASGMPERSAAMMVEEPAPDETL